MDNKYKLTRIFTNKIHQDKICFTHSLNIQKKINIITTYILANITPSSTITSSIQEYATLSD